MKTIREARPGAVGEELVARRKDWESAPRAGIAIAIELGLQCAVVTIFNDLDVERNVLTQALDTEQPERKQATGAYVSPNTSAQVFTAFMSDVITHGTGRDWLVGDPHVRDNIWDTVAAGNGRTIRTRITDTRFRVLEA